MAMSGITVSDNCVDAFFDLQKHHKNRYIIYKIEDKKMVVVDKTQKKCDKDKEVSAKELWTEFASLLMQYEGAYAVYDAEYFTKLGVKREKVVFILWCPDEGSTIKTRMLYTSTSDTIKKKFTGVSAVIQANDPDDLKWDSIVEKIEQNKQ